MFLVDKQIKQLIKTDNLIENAATESIGAISCDLSIDYIIEGNKKNTTGKQELEPGDTIIIATKEIIHMPKNMIGQIIPKNSRIRMGVKIDAPIYQPGHNTKIFISVTNVSADVIEIESGEQIAAIAFSYLSEEPENVYSGGFQNENEYKGLADYESIWGRRKRKIEDKYKNIKDLEKNIYSNVMLLMTIFIGIFSLINIEVGFLKGSALNFLNMLMYNLIFAGGLSLLVGVINCILPCKKSNRSTAVIFAVAAVCLIAAAILVYR